MKCPKFGKVSGDQCMKTCPMPGSPHFSAVEQVKQFLKLATMRRLRKELKA